MEHNKQIQGLLTYMPTKPILLAGPWQGEFGWELMRWHAGLRYLARTGNYDKVVVAIQKGHELLYQDFADEILYVPRGNNTDGWKNDHHAPQFSKMIIDSVYKKYPFHKLQIYNPNEKSTLGNENQLFIHFGKKTEENSYDLIIHARNTGKSKSARRNWNQKHWIEVIKYFKKYDIKMACIGMKEQSMHFSSVDNHIGISLEPLSNILASSKLIIGPSSGPMHLATLCGCPQLVWTDKKKWISLGMQSNRYRYETLWNPFGIKTYILDDCNWQPQVSVVIREIKKILHI